MLAWFAGIACAQVTFEAVTRVLVGESPVVTFRSTGHGELDGGITCVGEPEIQIHRLLEPGTVVEVPLPGLSEGLHACSGGIRLTTPDLAQSELPLSFSVEIRSPLTFRVAVSDWDRDRRSLAVHPSRPLRAAEAVVIGVGGREIDRASGSGGEPVFQFSTPEEVLQIVVTATDDAGLRSQLTLSPWFYAIPHEDVVFDSGSSVITGTEEPKLGRVWVHVEGVLAKYGSIVEIRLYVAGYTDTVGAAASNQALSVSRARAIAQWFVQRGFPGQVWYQGMGEHVPAVVTPDETPEVRNRRALYLLAADPPAPSRDLPAQDWVRLR
jgi:outer membrane protein OmpA-like peptidoglycan-associated protein